MVRAKTVLHELVDGLGFEEQAVDEAEASEAHERGFEERVVAPELGAERIDVRFRDDRVTRPLDVDVLAALDDEMDAAHRLLHRTESPRGSVRSGRNRAGERLAVARSARRECEPGALDGAVELHHVDAALGEHEMRGSARPTPRAPGSS